jgi:hypothetical protein
VGVLLKCDPSSVFWAFYTQFPFKNKYSNQLFLNLSELKMALSQAAALVEKVIGHGNNEKTEQDITNPARDRAKYADPGGEKMKALVWMDKNKVEIRKCLNLCVLLAAVSRAMQMRFQNRE